MPADLPMFALVLASAADKTGLHMVQLGGPLLGFPRIRIIVFGSL